MHTNYTNTSPFVSLALLVYSHRILEGEPLYLNRLRLAFYYSTHTQQLYQEKCHEHGKVVKRIGNRFQRKKEGDACGKRKIPLIRSQKLSEAVDRGVIQHILDLLLTRERDAQLTLQVFALNRKEPAEIIRGQ